MVELPAGGSAAQNPDLDWSQIRETLLMLGIAVAQVRHAMEESGASFSTLATSFSNTCVHIEELKSALTRAVTDHPERLQLEAKIGEISAQNSKSIMAFQFYDRLSQRLDHVCDTIGALAVLVSDRTAIFQPDSWLSLQQRIRSQYSMEQEKVLFDAILQGVPVKDAIALAGNVSIKVSKDEHEDGGIELF